MIEYACLDPECILLADGIDISITISPCTIIHTNLGWQSDKSYTIFSGNVETTDPLLKDILNYNTDFWESICLVIEKSPEAQNFQKRIDNLIAKYTHDEQWE